MVSSFFGTPNFPQSPESLSPTNEPTRTWTSIVSSVGKDWSWWIHIDRTLEKSEPMAQGRIFCQVIQAAVTFTSSAIIGGHVSWKKGSLNHLKKVTSRIARCFFLLGWEEWCPFEQTKLIQEVFFQKKDYYPGNDHICHPKAFRKTSLLSHWWDMSVSSLEGMLESEWFQQFQG